MPACQLFEDGLRYGELSTIITTGNSEVELITSTDASGDTFETMSRAKTGSTGERAPTVMVVDDQPEIVELYTCLLQDDYDVRTAAGGEQALSVVDESVDVVFLDRRMPDYTGRDVFERIQQRSLDVQVVLVTGTDPDADELPFDACLRKPIAAETLRATAERLLTCDDADR